MTRQPLRPILVSDNHVEVHGQEFSGSMGIVVLAGFSHVEGNTIVINSATVSESAC